MIEENLAVLRSNLAENPDLAETIEIVESPIASKSNERVLGDRERRGVGAWSRPLDEGNGS